LRRCLHDEDVPADTRTAGALIRLDGLRTTDVLTLRSDQVVERDQDHWHTYLAERRIDIQ